jgi:hypothetical protein
MPDNLGSAAQLTNTRAKGWNVHLPDQRSGPALRPIAGSIRQQ